MDSESINIFGGSGSQLLTKRICEHLRVEAGKGTIRRFSEGNIFVQVGENVRGHDVFLVQSTAHPVNDNFMEMLFWIDAFKRASAATVTVLIPYFSYAKGDKKDEPRVSIRARVCADAIESAGADRVVTMDIHAPQIQGFFRIPVDDLRALPIICNALRPLLVNRDAIVVSPDAGFTKRARMYADALGLSLAIGVKSRKEHNEDAEVYEIIGDVRGKTAILVDDFTISGGTLIDASKKLFERGAVSVLAAVTHGVFGTGARERLDASRLEKLIVTDTVELPPEYMPSKVEVVSVASLFADAIRRIHERKSLSVLFSTECVHDLPAPDHDTSQ